MLGLQEGRRQRRVLEVEPDAPGGVLAAGRRGRFAQLQEVVDEFRQVDAVGIDPPDRHPGADGEANDFGGAADALFAFAIPNRDQKIAISHHEAADLLITLVRHRAAAVQLQHFGLCQQRPEIIERVGEVLFIFGLRKRQWRIEPVAGFQRLAGDQPVAAFGERRQQPQRKGRSPRGGRRVNRPGQRIIGKLCDLLCDQAKDFGDRRPHAVRSIRPERARAGDADAKSEPGTA